jgi:hypothetical protein
MVLAADFLFEDSHNFGLKLIFKTKSFSTIHAVSKNDQVVETHSVILAPLFIRRKARKANKIAFHRARFANRSDRIQAPLQALLSTRVFRRLAIRHDLFLQKADPRVHTLISHVKFERGDVIHAGRVG